VENNPEEVPDDFFNKTSTEPRKNRSTNVQKVMSYKNIKGFSRIDNINQKYTFKKELGSGAFGTVFSAVHKKAETLVAIKVIHKKDVQKGAVYEKLMRQELEVLEELDNPHVVRVIELLENDEDYFIVMELIADGNLLDFVNKCSKKGLKLKERDIANLINQMITGLCYMHSKNIVHRDLKLENMMI
jgi:serine/threonine protein kinase